MYNLRTRINLQKQNSIQTKQHRYNSNTNRPKLYKRNNKSNLRTRMDKNINNNRRNKQNTKHSSKRNSKQTNTNTRQWKSKNQLCKYNNKQLTNRSTINSSTSKTNNAIYGELEGDTNKNGVIDGSEAPKITKTIVSNSATANEVQYTITLSGLEEAVRQTGKNFKEWSGNIALKIAGRGQATSTYTTNMLKDSYGNQSMMETDETNGTWVNVEFKDGEIVQNTNGKMFTDFIKPEFTYKYSTEDINYDDKTLTVVFDITDKYFNNTTITKDNICVYICCIII